MEVFHGIDSLKFSRGTCVTPGTFDGVHFGHRKIISHLIAMSEESGLQSVALTFHPHPRKILFPEQSGLQLLNTLDERLELLSQTGVDAVVIYPFSLEFSRTSALKYVRDLLVEKLNMRRLVIGYDHQFGKNREGSIENLRDFAPMFGFDIAEIPAQDIDNVNISSTKIRQALIEGDVALANQYLGYDYFLHGLVVKGSERGRLLGFPTANIAVNNPDKLIPGVGVYAVDITVEDQRFIGMMNIGHNPTFSNNAPRTIEVNIFELDSDLYGKELKITMRARIRNEQKFSSGEELIEQLKKDRVQALSILND